MIKILVIYNDCDLVIRKMLSALSEDPNYEVTIAAPSDWEVNVEGNCRLVQIQPIKSKLSLSAIYSLRRIVKSERPDIIYSISTKALSTSLFATLGIKGIKNIGYRGTQAKVRRSDPTYYLGVLNPRVDHIVCETIDIEKYLQHFLPKDKLSMACKPFELSWVSEAMKSPYKLDDNNGDKLQLIYIGVSKGRPHKGMKQLVKAMEILHDEPVHLTVIGETNEEVVENAPDNISFKGNRTDAIQFLPNADLFVLSSTRDASPRVLREAQACGIPCIVTDIPGARDLIVNNVTGILVSPDSPSAIANAIHSLSTDRDNLKLMGKAARQNIAENFQMDSYVSYFKNLFSIISSRK